MTQRTYRFKAGSSVTLRIREDLDIVAGSYDEAYDSFMEHLENQGCNDSHMGIVCEGVGFDIEETDPA